MSGVRAEIERRLEAYLHRLKAGDDLPPGARLRLEGLFEALVLEGLATEEELNALLETAVTSVWGHGLVDELGAAWRDSHPFPDLPLYQRRAPVSPSTSD